MIVICLEGCHGCGKTELCLRFERAGFEVLDEAFLDMPSFGLHPQSLVMETSWVSSWFQRLLRRASTLADRGESHAKQVFIADRSPLSAVFYCHHGELLRPLIQKQMEELRTEAGIEIFTVLIRVEREALWARIQARLAREPDRVLYKEDRRDWLDKVADFYETCDLWNMEVDNSEEDVTESLQELLARTVALTCSQVPALRKHVAAIDESLLLDPSAETAMFGAELEEKEPSELGQVAS